MNTFEEKLEKYAELVVKNGANVQKNQDVLITAPISAIEFVRIITEKAYKAGAKHVHFRWRDDAITLTHFKYAPDEDFNEFPEWEAKRLEALSKKGAAFIDLKVPDPALLAEIDPKKVAAANAAEMSALMPYRKYRMADRVSWTLVSVPSEGWAKSVFPELTSEKAVAKLWDAIFTMTRADLEDPVQAWEEHKNTLNEKAQYLNNKKYMKFYYKAPGTDLTIEMNPKHIWASAASSHPDGTAFIKNIPTEEVYTLPLKEGVNGTVSSTMPLNYNSTLIEGIKLTFENGRIVEFNAEKGYETLKGMIETDEGSHYLGEVALVPYDSPISQSGIIFFNTLFDENASCHLAIGKAYPTCLEGGTEMTDEELAANGVNDSLNHVDFMIGSNELDIDGETADGTREPIMRNGLWVI